MIPGDYAPPAVPTLDQQRDALRKGLGRAVQWALAGRLAGEPLLEACLRDQRFDLQIDCPRGEWLWQMIRVIGAADHFRVPILHALHDLSLDIGTADQLCDLARWYGSTGDEAFRTRLYEIVEQKPIADSPWLGEEAVINLDGGQGLLFAARLRGRQLADRAWEWDDYSLIDAAVKRIGEEAVNGLLQASSDEAIRRFRESWRQDSQRKPVENPRTAHRERMRAIPVEEVVRAAEGENACFWLRGWGMHADGDGLRAVLRHLGAAQQPGVFAKLLRVFSARALPEFDARLIDLCRHADPEVRRRALLALGNNRDTRVREFALSELPKGLRDSATVGIFLKNYESGDENRILNAMELPGDVVELHWLLSEILDVLKANPGADASRPGLIGYALTPCTNCRFSAARLLFEQRVAPGWLTEECRFDSNEDCRKLVENTTDSTRTT